MVCFITVFVLAHPDNLATHIVRETGLRGVAVRQNQQTIVAILVGVLDGLLETCAATADGKHLTHNLFQALDDSNAAVKLDDVDGFEAIAECAVNDSVKIAQTLAGDGTAHVHRHQQLGVETADRPHILKPGTAVGTHTGELSLV